ncbi:MAG: trigger factor [Candidatus Pacebacteria bacterium]|nr:trigger factor [Candidatus Paceibacterota bacterium]
MKYTIKKLPDSIREAEIVYDNKEFSDYWQEVYNDEIAKVNLKGFRPGAAPKELADKAVDKEHIFEHAVSDAVRHALKQIMEEKDLDIIDQPKVEVLEQKDGLKVKVILTVFPEIVLGNYKKIAKAAFEDKKEIKIEEGEVDKTIDWILKSRAQIIRSVQPAKKGDVVHIIHEGKPDKFILGEGQLKDGIEDKIVGHKEGEKFDGIELKEIFERKVPELTDEFVKGIGKFATVADFKKSITDGILKEKKLKDKERKQLKVLEGIIKESKIEMPQVMVERTYEHLVADYADFIKINPGKEEEFKKGLKKEAEKSVASNLIIHQIVKEENLEPTEDEIEMEENNVLKNLPKEQALKLEHHRIHSYCYDVVKNRKVFEYLEKL